MMKSMHKTEIIPHMQYYSKWRKCSSRWAADEIDGFVLTFSVIVFSSNHENQFKLLAEGKYLFYHEYWTETELK